MAVFKINISEAEKVTSAVIGNLTLTLDHGETHTFGKNDFTVNTTPQYIHPDDANPSKIKLTQISNITEGDLLYNNTAVTLNQEINFSNINLLIYKSNSNNDNAYSGDTFRFNIADEDSEDYNDNIYGEIFFDVLALKNQPPTVGNVEVTTDYLQSIVITTQMFLDSIPEYSDPENDQPELLKIITLPTNGILRLDGIIVEENDVINFSDISNGLLTFTPNSNNGQAFMDEFDFQIADSGSQQFVG